MTSEEPKGSKGEKLVEVDTDLSWDHKGLVPLPKSHTDRLNGSPKLPRVPKGTKEEGNNEGTLRKSVQALEGIIMRGNTQNLSRKKMKLEY